MKHMPEVYLRPKMVFDQQPTDQPNLPKLILRNNNQALEVSVIASFLHTKMIFTWSKVGFLPTGTPTNRTFYESFLNVINFV